MSPAERSLLFALAIFGVLDCMFAALRWWNGRRLRKVRRREIAAHDEGDGPQVDGVMFYRPAPRQRREIGAANVDRPITVRSCIGLPGLPCNALVHGQRYCGACARARDEWMGA